MVHENPTVFISYSWDSQDHIAWVLSFAAELQETGGINVIVDKVNYSRKDSLTAFMHRSIRDSDYVLVICTPRYKQKADALEGNSGAGIETIISLTFFYASPEKFIPILRSPLSPTAAQIPSYLANYSFYDFSSEANYETEADRLIKEIWGIKEYALPRAASVPKPRKPTDVIPLNRKFDSSIALGQIAGGLDKICREFYLFFGCANQKGVFPYIDPKFTANDANESTEVDSRKAYPFQKRLQYFLSNRGKSIWMILGEYGSGKTLLCKRLCALIHHGTGEHSQYVPILLEFRRCSNVDSNDIEGWLTKALLARYGNNPQYSFSWGISFCDVVALSQTRNILLVLDGFDEAIISSASTALDIYNAITLYISTILKGIKVIITSRPNPFESERAILFQHLQIPASTVGRNLVELERPYVLLDHLEEFDINDISEYTANYFTDNKALIAFTEAMAVSPNIGELSRKPVFLNMLVQRRDIKELKENVPLTLFADIIENWVGTSRSITSVEANEFIRILRELAFLIFISSHNGASESTLRKHIALNYSGSQAILERLILEVENCTFLIRNSDGHFVFSHNTFMEFLVASKLFDELLTYNNSNFYVRLLTDPINQFICEMIEVHDQKSGLISIKDRKFTGMVYVEPDEGYDDLTQTTLDGFYIDVFPVTNEDYRKFLIANPRMVPPVSEGRDLLIDLGKRANLDWYLSDVDGYISACRRYCWDTSTRDYPEGSGDMPATYVSYFDSWSYARWLNKRLPTFAQWLKAATWDPVEKKSFVYGIRRDKVDPSCCNIEGQYGGPTPVTKFQSEENSIGLREMTGNVCEWTVTWSDKRELHKIIAGGAWHFRREDVLATKISISFPNLRRNFVGFRLVVNVT